jgi:hypothetical protein
MKAYVIHLDSQVHCIDRGVMARQKRKTAVVTLRIEPRLKVAAEKAASHDQRSLTNLIEVLLVERCKNLNIPLGATAEDEA